MTHASTGLGSDCCKVTSKYAKTISWPNTLKHFHVYVYFISSYFLRIFSGQNVSSCLYCGTSGIWSLTVFSILTRTFLFSWTSSGKFLSFFVSEYCSHQNATFMPFFCVICTRNLNWDCASVCVIRYCSWLWYLLKSCLEHTVQICSAQAVLLPTMLHRSNP